MMKKVAIVRGKFLNKYEMQIFEPLRKKYQITAFASYAPFHDTFTFSTVKLPSPMDIPEFPFKMQILNRLFVDAHYLYELEENIKGYDIVHSAETFYSYTHQALNAKKKGYVKKVIATVLENIPFNNEGIRGRKQFKETARRELDHIIALTKRTKTALLLEGADPKKITVIPHGIDTKNFKPTDTFLQQISSVKKDICIVFAGRLEVYKGVFEILYSAKMLINDKDLKKFTIHVMFVGDGSEKKNMLAMEKRLGIEPIVEHVHVPYKNMPQLYQKADIFVAPSKASKYWQEQYNTTLLEAQASSLPIVTTYSGGIVENVGDAAVLVQPGDTLSLTYALKKFILDPNLRLLYAKKARQRAQTIHEANNIAKRIAQVYEKVLAEK